MNKVVALAPAVAVAVTAAGLVGYAIALLLAAFFGNGPESVGASMRSWFMDSPAANIGIPCSAIAAFAIVAVLLRAFPPKDERGALTFKAFGLEFTGPSGPITLWLMCFLGFIFAMRLMRA
jgi:hypothetical protein